MQQRGWYDVISEEQLQEKVLARLDLSREIGDDELTELIFQVLDEESDGGYIPLKKKAELGRDLYNAFRRLDLLQDLLEDQEITEIMINGTQNIFVEKKGKIYRTDKRFPSRSRLEDVIQQIVAGANRMVNESVPIADARLPDGSRVNVVLYPVALNGPVVTIRKFPTEQITMQDLVRMGAVSDEAAGFLKMLVIAGYNIFISGGTGSGKTTLLNALSQFIPGGERVITIEDNAELQIQGVPNLVRLEARNPNMEGVGEITIRQLIRTALRMRPDRIIVGEVRGTETIDMIQAMSTGHRGSLSTGHSDSPRDMLRRLETMVLMGMDIPLAAIQRQIASAIDIIIHVGRLRDRSRKVLEIVEVLDYEDGEIQTGCLYEFQETKCRKTDGVIEGRWQKVRPLLHTEKLLSAGYQTP
nr:CpaF family protein [Lachnoclostridium phocaeense]